MPRDYNINISVGGGNRRGAFGGGNLFKSQGTLDSSMYGNQESGNSITTGNLKKVVSLGMAFNTAQKANEVVGAFTENRLRQRRIDAGMTFAKYGIGISINPLAGAVYALSDLTYRTTMYNIRKGKKDRESDYYNRLSGNNSNSGRRYGGEFS